MQQEGRPQVLPLGLNGMLEGASVVVRDVTELLQDAGSRSSGDAEVLGCKLLKILCLISFAAHSLGHFSCPFSTCFKVWAYSASHEF